MSARTPSRPLPADYPLQFRLLLAAADHECPPGHADALRELTTLALLKVPARGIFDPTVRGEHDLFVAIEDVANRHLDMKPARAAWSRTLHGADLDPDLRDQIEQAAQQLQGVFDTAYFYAGLAFGVTALTIYRAGS